MTCKEFGLPHNMDEVATAWHVVRLNLRSTSPSELVSSGNEIEHRSEQCGVMEKETEFLEHVSEWFGVYW